MNISGKRIREERERQELHQVDIAVAMNLEFEITIDRSDISEIELGYRGLKDFELDAISKILDVTPAWLLRGEE